MRTIETQILIFAVGAFSGSLVTYLVITRDARAIAKVRDEIRNLALHHEMTKQQWNKASHSETFVTDQEILGWFAWAQAVKRDKYVGKKYRGSLAILAAEAIICEKLLGLTRHDALKALFKITNLHELKTVVQPKTSMP